MKDKINLPKIGLRNIKTAISATLISILYIIFERNPTFACIGAVFGMDNSIKASWRTGGNRLIGTIIGGFIGMGFFYLYTLVDNRGFKIALLFIGIILHIYVCQLLKVPGAIQGGSVVFYIVMLNTPQDQYISYALNRMVDTGVGVIMSIVINLLFSREHLEKWFPKLKGSKEGDRILDDSEDSEEASENTSCITVQDLPKQTNT